MVKPIYKDLFASCVGSHMWNMEKETSDIDIVKIYQQDSHSILSGINPRLTHPDKKEIIDDIEYDVKYQEIGHLINNLIKGNVNAIWTICSPIAYDICMPPYREGVLPSYREELKDITLNNLSKVSVSSILGMASSQVADEMKRNLNGKGYRTAMRTLIFGYNLFTYGVVEFDAVKYSPDLEVVNGMIEDFEQAYDNSMLPDEPNEDEFRDFLYKIRMDFMVQHD